MYKVFSNRRLLYLAIILIASNLIIAGISMIVIYNKSVSTLENTLIDIVERQKSLITALHEQGKSEQEIIHLMKIMREKHYGVGRTGEFAIARQVGDRTNYLLANNMKLSYNLNNSQGHGLPMRLAIQGKSGFVFAKDYNGVPVLAAYTFVPALQWGVVAKVPTIEVNQPYYHAIGLALFISVLLISLCLILFVKISNPIIKTIVDSEETYRMLFESINDAVFISELNESGKVGNFIKVNDIACQRLGYTQGELLTKTPIDISSENARLNVDSLITDILERKHAIVESEHVTKDGKIIPVEISTNVTQFRNKTIFHSIARDITERKQTELELKEKNEEIEAQGEEYLQINEELSQINSELYLAKEHAEESDRLKTSFLQNMSHEIRTPMNAIMGFSELLVQNYNNKPKLEKFSQIINQRCEDLLDIINGILDIAKIESGQLPINIEECNLHDLFAELTIFFTEHQKRIGKQHINFSLKSLCSPSETEIVTDKVKLKQIFINLIGNAFKFTDKGKIEGGCQIDANHNLIFYVSDSGIGIPSDKQHVIFERFTQLKHDRNQAYGGTGLGLSIVKGLVDLLDGKIWIESQPGEGTTFYFSIPYKATRILQHKSLIINELETLQFQNKTILVVEDDFFNTEYIKEILSDTGLNILHTEYGKDAIQIASIHSPDLVLMDVRLPDINGYEASRKIMEHNPNLKIIAQTAYAAHEDKQKATEAGCIDYISKPLKRDLLLSMINKHLSQQ